LLEKKEKEIDGHVFRYQPLMATEARKILVGLIQRFGGSVASGVEGLANSDISDVDGDTEISEMLGKMANSVAGIVRQLTISLTPEYYEKLVDTFGKQTEIKVVSDAGQVGWPMLGKGTRDVMFGTALLTEAKWVAFCLEVQYSDFFGLVRTAAAKAVALGIAKTKSPSSSPTGSTGTSSE
jgi:hypothetical protein